MTNRRTFPFARRPPGSRWIAIGRPRARGRPSAIAAGFLLFLAVGAAAQRIQDATDPGVRQAIAAYEAGDLVRALELLESAPSSLAPRDGSIRALYLGLIHVAQGAPTRAREAFMLAVRLDPAARLDPDLHAPSRVAAFTAGRDAVVAEWRGQAGSAEAAGNAAEALRLWRGVLAALPEDRDAKARIAAIEEAERQAAAARAAAAAVADSLRQAIGGQRDTAQLGRTDSTPARADPTEAARSMQTYSAGGALAMGLVVPGLGQMYAGRRILGLVSLAAAGSAAAAGFLYERVSVDCRIQPVNGSCPPADVLNERSERPYLTAGLAGAVAVTLIGALDGFLSARRANARAAGAGASGRSGLAILPDVRADAHQVRVEWVRIRF